MRGVAGFTLVLLAACSGRPLSTDGGGSAFEGGSDVPADRDAVGSEAASGGSCDLTHDRATIVVRLANGVVRSCETTDGGIPASPDTWIGKVTASDSGSLTLDPCGADAGLPVDAGCTSSSIRIEAQASGLDLSGFPHVWVRVRAKQRNVRVCVQSLEITTADPADGSAPQTAAGRLLLAVVDGGDIFDGSPYEVGRVRLGCSVTDARGCGGSSPPGAYAFDFKSTNGGDAPLRVSMGETATWTLDGAALRVRNLRSFQSEACDDYWNFAYTIYSAPN